MGQQTGFIADIVTNPTDNTPRLIYCDWLEENGRPERAEFIRTQITLSAYIGRVGKRYQVSSDAARENVDLDNPVRERLQRRETELFTLEAARGNHGLPAKALKDTSTVVDATYRALRIYDISLKDPNPYIRLYWQRGFVDNILCRWRDFTLYYHYLSSVQPLTTAHVGRPTLLECTTYDLHTPRGWCSGLSIGYYWWDWKSLGAPPIADPSTEFLIKLIMRHQYPTVRIDYPVIDQVDILSDEETQYLTNLKFTPERLAELRGLQSAAPNAIVGSRPGGTWQRTRRQWVWQNNSL